MQKRKPPESTGPFDVEERTLRRVLYGALIAALLFLIVGALSHAPGGAGASPQALDRAKGGAANVGAAVRALRHQEVDPFSPAND